MFDRVSWVRPSGVACYTVYGPNRQKSLPKNAKWMEIYGQGWGDDLDDVIERAAEAVVEYPAPVFIVMLEIRDEIV